MVFSKTPLLGAYLIDLEKLGDKRGFFARYFCEQEFSQEGLNTNWSQINNSLSAEQGTLRGMHFQIGESAEVKLIRCIAGSIWDCIVDMRPSSPTFGRSFGATLSQVNRTMMYVPEGFAHGFITLEPETEVIYLVSRSYDPKAERGLSWNDPVVGIEWPMRPRVISDKDMNNKSLAELRVELESEFGS